MSQTGDLRSVKCEQFCHVCDARQIKELGKENARLKKLIAEQALDVSILRDVISKKLLGPAKHLAAVKYAVVKHHVAERRAIAGYYKLSATVAFLNLLNAVMEVISVLRSSDWLLITDESGIGWLFI